MHHAAPGVKMTSLLFAKGTDCVLVGDSDGQVTFYELKNLSVGEGKEVKLRCLYVVKCVNFTFRPV